MKKTTPVKVSVISVIYKAVIPAFYRLTSLLEDATSGDIPISDVEKAGLLEATSCAITLKSIFEDYLEDAKTHKVETLHIPNAEFKTILEMSKAVEASHSIYFMKTGIWSH